MTASLSSTWPSPPVPGLSQPFRHPTTVDYQSDSWDRRQSYVCDKLWYSQPVRIYTAILTGWKGHLHFTLMFAFHTTFLPQAWSGSDFASNKERSPFCRIFLCSDRGKNMFVRIKPQTVLRAISKQGLFPSTACLVLSHCTLGQCLIF